MVFGQGFRHANELQQALVDSVKLYHEDDAMQRTTLKIALCSDYPPSLCFLAISYATLPLIED